MSEIASDWRARILAVLDQKLDPQTKMALAFFATHVRKTVRAYLAQGASDVMTRLLAVPVVAVLYAQLLRTLRMPPQAPSPDLIASIVDDLIAEYRSHGTR